MITINSRFLTQNITGVQRFAIEISKQLKNIYGNNIEFATPKNIIHKDLEKELNATICVGREFLYETYSYRL